MIICNNMVDAVVVVRIFIIVFSTSEVKCTCMKVIRR